MYSRQRGRHSSESSASSFVKLLSRRPIKMMMFTSVALVIVLFGIFPRGAVSRSSANTYKTADKYHSDDKTFGSQTNMDDKDVKNMFKSQEDQNLDSMGAVPKKPQSPYSLDKPASKETDKEDMEIPAESIADGGKDEPAVPNNPLLTENRVYVNSTGPKIDNSGAYVPPVQPDNNLPKLEESNKKNDEEDTDSNQPAQDQNKAAPISNEVLINKTDIDLGNKSPKVLSQERELSPGIENPRQSLVEQELAAHLENVAQANVAQPIVSANSNNEDVGEKEHGGGITLKKTVEDSFHNEQDKKFASVVESPVDTFQKQNSQGTPADALTRIEILEQEIKELRSLLKKSDKTYLAVKFKNYRDRKRILVTGGTGFVGSHLVDKLMLDGHEVIALDNHFTGRKRNVEHWIGHPNFELIHHDIMNPFFVEVDQVYHLASPASPPHYMYNPVRTLKTNALGTINVLGVARRTKARVLLASTSEVYGDPEVHPQPETYWGHVNPVGPRSCYDEGKRAAEALMVAYQKQEHVEIRIARIFNTFGPRMHMSDGRVVSNFILQALKNEDITIYGDGNQTRSFQYVTDLVEGLVALMNSKCDTPVNIGNPEEYTVQSFATIIKGLVDGSTSKIVHEEAKTDDPKQRKPDIRKAAQEIGWSPKVSMVDGLKKTIAYFRDELTHNQIMGGQIVGPVKPGTPLEHFENHENNVEIGV